jgi:hypothetical protein
MLIVFAWISKPYPARKLAWIAQLAERSLGKTEVSGSTPDPGSNLIKFIFEGKIASNGKKGKQRSCSDGL